MRPRRGWIWQGLALRTTKSTQTWDRSTVASWSSAETKRRGGRWTRRRRRGLRRRFGEATEQFGTLLQNSLAQRVDTAADPRFWMLETIREFGLEAPGQPMRQRASDDATLSTISP